jgi:hypothetical protein
MVGLIFVAVRESLERFGVMSYESGEEACYQKELDDKKFEFPYQKDSCVLKYFIKPLARNAVFY